MSLFHKFLPLCPYANLSPTHLYVKWLSFKGFSSRKDNGGEFICNITGGTVTYNYTDDSGLKNSLAFSHGIADGNCRDKNGYLLKMAIQWSVE